MNLTDLRPLHIVGGHYARWTLCGIRINDKAALPYGHIRYVERRRLAGYSFCPDCWDEYTKRGSSETQP
jgi:hypothetical protein